MSDASGLFARVAHPAPVAAAERGARIADPGFGKVFTDHMALVRYNRERGWHDAQITARGPIALDPAAAVLHYAQEIFEGLKAYRLADGSMSLFRPDANAARFAASAERMAMPELPRDLFLGSIEALVDADRDWFPTCEGGSIYLRPFMFASEVFLGVRPANEYLFITLAVASGAYFKAGAKPVRLLVSSRDSRAGPGGTGAAKCGGNYAASLRAQSDAIARGFDQVIFIDGAEHRWIEELGGMNLFFVMADGSIVTPALNGSILPGITRDSLITLARDQGITVREERYAIDQLRADLESGDCREIFACGTAAVVTPVGHISGDGWAFAVSGGEPGEVTLRLRRALTDIQSGEAPDPHGWVHRI